MKNKSLGIDIAYYLKNIFKPTSNNKIFAYSLAIIFLEKTKITNKKSYTIKYIIFRINFKLFQ